VNIFKKRAFAKSVVAGNVGKERESADSIVALLPVNSSIAAIFLSPARPFVMTLQRLANVCYVDQRKNRSNLTWILDRT
jgi:hypothetical protein